MVPSILSNFGYLNSFFQNIPLGNHDENPAEALKSKNGNVSEQQRTMKRKSKGKHNFGIIKLQKIQTRLGMQFLRVGELMDIAKK